MPFKASGRGAYGPQGQKVIKGPLAPVWVTGAGQVGSANLGASVSVQLSATDDSGDAPTYTIASGALPTGLSLSSSGLISGTLGGSAGTATFTVNATDVNGRATTSGSFTFLSIQPAWTALTFTTNSTGVNGPSAGNVTANFTGTASAWSVSSGVILLTIPVTGSYRIDIAGARGGNANNGSGGQAARIVGTTTLTGDAQYKVVVGQPGGDRPGGSQQGSGGGGGASFVAANSGNIPIVIAGGGGGSAGAWPGYSSYGAGNASTSTVPNQSNGCNNCAAIASGGNGGNNCSPGAAAGGGWFSAGSSSGTSNGAAPGQALSGIPTGGVNGDNGGVGGFGGGGGGRNVIAGGGGGYNGGNTPGDSSCTGGGAGGSSYTSGFSVESSNLYSGAGYVTFTRL